eukprot:UN15828
MDQVFLLRFIFLYLFAMTNSRGDFVDDFSMRWMKSKGFSGCEHGKSQCVYSDPEKIEHDVFQVLILMKLKRNFNIL